MNNIFPVNPNKYKTQELPCQHAKDNNTNLSIPNTIINQNYNFSSSVSFFKFKNIPEEQIPLVAEVSFKNKRRKFYRNDNKLPLFMSQLVLVDVENGVDIGTICTSGFYAQEKLNSQFNNDAPEFSVIRHANDEDLIKYNSIVDDEIAVVDRARELVRHYNLEMKVTEAEWQFDKQRLTIYFTAPQRIDFRELVKDLARTFRTRIELRQISTREEARRLGGIGCCGLSLCCTRNLCDSNHITLDHAKTQQLSNNVSKLSGYCGRLKCCLLYEYDVYVEAFKKFPPINSQVAMANGNARIVKIDIFKDIVYVHYDSVGTYVPISLEEINQLQADGKITPPPETNNENFVEKKKRVDAFNDIIIDEDLIQTY